MSLGYSPTDPDDPPKRSTLVDKTMAVIVLIAVIVGAFTLFP